MKNRNIKIRNSQGCHISNLLLDNPVLRDKVEIEVINDQLIIHPKKSGREWWKSAFQAMALNKDDQLFDREELFDLSSWDAKEWEW